MAELNSESTQEHAPQGFPRVRAFKMDLTLVFAGLLLATVLTIIFYTDYKHSHVLLDVSDDLTSLLASSVITKTTDYMAPAQQFAELTSHLVDAPKFSLTESPSLEAYLVQTVRMQPQFSMFYVGDKDGNYLMAARDADGNISTHVIDRAVDSKIKEVRYRDAAGTVIRTDRVDAKAFDPRTRPWYKEAEETRQRCWTDMYIFFTGGEPGITAAHPVIGEDGELRGVVGADITLSGLSGFLRTLKVTKRGTVFIMNDRKELVAHPHGKVFLWKDINRNHGHLEGNVFSVKKVGDISP